MREVVVLGGGMAGIGSAIHLQLRGWTVALVDRQAPGLETSFGNAGIIQGEAVEPYAMPRDLATLFAIATGRSNDVHYRLRSLHHHVGPLMRYWCHSAPRRHGVAANAYSSLISHATEEHGALIALAGVADLVSREGFHILYRTTCAMDAAAVTSERLRTRYGVRSRALSPQALLEAEPALKMPGAGAIH